MGTGSSGLMNGMEMMIYIINMLIEQLIKKGLLIKFLRKVVDRYRPQVVAWMKIQGDKMIDMIGFSEQDLVQYKEFCEDTREHLSNIPPGKQAT